MSFQRNPNASPRRNPISGSLAVLLSLPAAFTCLWSLGFDTYDTRMYIHSPGVAFGAEYTLDAFKENFRDIQQRNLKLRPWGEVNL